MNKIILMGRLTGDPELRQTPSGVPVASFTIAVDRPHKSDSGETATDFIDCIAWRKTAELVSQYFTKGKKILVEGKLQLRDWVDKNNNKRRTAEVIVDYTYFCEKREENRDGYSNSGYGQSYATAPQAAPSAPAQQPEYPAYAQQTIPSSGFTELDMDDGDLPF